MVSATHEERIEQSSPAEPPVGASRTQKCGDRILLVEDDRPTLRLEQVILEEAGYLVQGVGSGEAALELISEDPPALVILDMGLPGMDGFTTCQSIREVSQVPVVMVISGKTAAHRKKGTASGANGYITKPFSTDKLVELAAEFIAEPARYSWEGEDSQSIERSLAGSQLAETSIAPATSSPVPDVEDPIAKSELVRAEDADQPEDQPMEAALPWHNGDSPDPLDPDPVNEQTEDDPTEVTVLWYSEEQQSPPEDPNSDESLDWYGQEPGSSRQDESQTTAAAPAAAGHLDSGKSSASPSPEEQLAEQPAEPTDQSIDQSASSVLAPPAGDLADTAHEGPAPADEPADELGDD